MSGNSDTVKRVLTEKYFACALAEDVERIWTHFEDVTKRPHPQAAQWMSAMMHYYGDQSPAGITWGVTRSGAEGELAAVRVNTSRPLVKAKIALVTASQVTWAVREKKDSAAAGYATALSRSLMEDVWTRRGLAVADVQLEELSQVLTAGYGFIEWDRTRGPDAVIDAAAGMRRPAGDVRLSLLPPWMVATDPNRDSAEDQDWWYVALDRPKADLVVLYPSLADEREGDEAAEAIYGVPTPAGVGRWDDNALRVDLARVIHFIHRPTLALPLGRHVVMLAGDVILRDTPLIGERGDYEMVPLVRRASDEHIGTPFGYSSYLDCLGPQEILDAHHTTQSTIITSFGNPVLAMEKGTEIEPADVATFGRPAWFPPGGTPPGYVPPPELAESHAKYGELLVERQQQIMALNDAALGQPQTAERNAQAEALFASMAVQQAGPAVLARRRSLSQLGQVWLTTLRKNVRGKRLVQMVGDGQANMVADTKQWTGSDLGPVDSVEMEEVAPEQATILGRAAILEQYLAAGIVKSPEEMEQVRSTGRLNRTVDPLRDAQLLQAVQYEMLSRGDVPLVHPTANTPEYYQANASVLLSTTRLANPKVRRAVEQTLALRYCMYFGLPPNADPHVDPLYVDRERFMLGTGPLPQPMPMPGAPAPGAAPGEPPAPGAAPFGQEQPMPSPSAGAPMQGAPTNPLTNQPFSPTEAPVQ